jgi:hypothetical protein
MVKQKDHWTQGTTFHKPIYLLLLLPPPPVATIPSIYFKREKTRYLGPVVVWFSSRIDPGTWLKLLLPWWSCGPVVAVVSLLQPR